MIRCLKAWSDYIHLLQLFANNLLCRLLGSSCLRVLNREPPLASIVDAVYECVNYLQELSKFCISNLIRNFLLLHERFVILQYISVKVLGEMHIFSIITNLPQNYKAFYKLSVLFIWNVFNTHLWVKMSFILFTLGLKFFSLSLAEFRIRLSS